MWADTTGARTTDARTTGGTAAAWTRAGENSETTRDDFVARGAASNSWRTGWW